MAKRYGSDNPNYRAGISGTSLGNIWNNVKQRCLNPNHPKFHRYGGRGISVCPDWMTAEGFKAWADSSGYQPGLTIDRIDNDGNYTPENCRWITAAKNSRAKRTTKLTFEQAQAIRSRLEQGEDATALAAEFGVVHGTIWFIQHRFTHVPDGECTKRLNERNQKNQQS